MQVLNTSEVYEIKKYFKWIRTNDIIHEKIKLNYRDNKNQYQMFFK